MVYCGLPRISLNRLLRPPGVGDKAAQLDH
eukprot:COSAG02_NODE_61222_length_269_cov_0.611765_1_plen_29_part_01